MVKETGCGFSLRSLPTGTSSVMSAVFAQIWTSVTAGDSNLRHQPSIRSITRLPTSQAPQVPPLHPGHGSAKHAFSEKIVIVTDYVLDSAPGTKQLFAEQLALFLLLRCDFHVAYYSPESFQKLCHSTRRACSHAKATSNKLVVASTVTVPADRTRDESRAHEAGPHGRSRRSQNVKPVRDRSNRQRTRRVSFFPVFWRRF